ncbi:MAG: hypothetical protein FWG90_01855 [Oscillospiraceae bacterium]|nr:hypothetical protein [Oscillospiraceae bacterium]
MYKDGELDMVTKTSNEYLTNRAWFRDTVGGSDVILCYTSALECLELFSGYLKGKDIDVYAKKQGAFDNINYRILETYDGIDVVKYGNVRCTSVNQTINDMLSDFDNIDEQSLVEGLSMYYHTHNESFDGLHIKPENTEKFNAIKDWAIEYYDD